ncbi:MAG: bifunctional demethylmenaquinone methyltransferase/2-methoxy-6-polyprenyl-1,4-benzoquinol methylase UbiE [Alphaproteobacteria bacterium]|nr:MAG: bifunctional demethylmenaquinone methyltransferase/2-methoxy-6-polyprenyl-1,4-benzoquinol methylase UbiE [Alphaproteobacteria bacterium]
MDGGEDRGSGRDGGSGRRTHFGFREVPEEEKARLVHEVFSSVAARYDLMNDLMSAGVHRIWKDAMVDWLAPRAGQEVLDVAGGTGDIAFRILRRAPGARVTVLDMTHAMLVEGRRRAEATEFADRLGWVCGDAMRLPFRDASFDLYTISFGLRNVTRIEDAIAEAHRVLRRGGRMMILEFSRVTNEMLERLYDLYSFAVIPRMGQVVTGDRDSYQYLVESIRRFPPQEELAGMLRAAGFGNVRWRNLSFGIAALHSAWKL